ncbi:Arylacetamide deacetylase [Lonchura striata]|uniref:Arylacetamide deacetylase n=1 Tax=Lonchura striata TaxID=40157 RepID=A0A218U9U9_9PASE|nr:arylacetamide deacetylase [Lonchura striata domestica]OWK50504.1 Arylacetamide deacetylase [Lonchura striata domestica]
MGARLLCLCLLTALLGYYIYSPLPEDLAQPWTVMLTSASLRALGHLAEAAELLGLMNYMEGLRLFTALELVAPTSDENVTVADTELGSVPVRLFVPRRAPGGLRRAVVYFHGGGWCVGDAGMRGYDLMSRRISNEINAVVVSVNYRLAPPHRFPAQFEDAYSVTKFFLQSQVLSQYGVDPARVCVAGDSAGGNLAAAVAQQLVEDPEVKTKLRAQLLIYPALQVLDLDLPSYRDNAEKPMLPRSLMVRFWSEYFASDPALREAMASNRHVPAEAAQLLPLVNWSRWLPAEMRGAHAYASPAVGDTELARRYPGLLDPRASPLLAGEARLRRLPRTLVLTCEHDVLRDDGAMYAGRLRQAGVPVTHLHAKDAFHGAVTFLAGPLELAVAHRLLDACVGWLRENL